MKRTSLEIVGKNDSETQEALSERSTSRDAVATIRGVNAIVVEWFNSGDGWVLGDVLQGIISCFCNAGIMEAAYDTYREHILQGLMASCPQTTEKH